MNLYAAHGLIADALAGRRILVLTYRQREIPQVIDELAHRCHHMPGVTITRTRRAERITFPGTGRIDVRPAGGCLRGMSADFVYLDEGADRIASVEALANIRHVLEGGTPGEIIRA